MNDSDWQRRAYLGAVVGALSAIAGCFGDSDDDAESPTPTLVDDPEILDYDATPLAYGTRLRISLEAKGDRELATVSIEYGDRGIEEHPNTTSATIEEVFEDTHLTGTDAVEFYVEDIDGHTNRTELNPDETTPTIQLEAKATDEAGRVKLAFDAADEVGLALLEAHLNEEPVLELDPDTIGGRAAYNAEELVDVAGVAAVELGQLNTITASVTDWNAQQQSTTDEAYIREYEPVEHPELDIGVYYQTWDEEWIWEDCTSAWPEIGRYTMSDGKEAVSRHVDLMQGFGISRLSAELSVPFNAEGLVKQLDEPIPSTMPVEILFHYINAIDWRGDRSIKEQLEYVIDDFRENLVERDQYVTTSDGRPVVTLWGIHYPPWNQGEIREFIHDEFEGYEGFVDYLRNRFAPGNTEAYLVGMANNLENIAPEADSEFHEVAKQFDALTHWMGGGKEATTPWEELYGYHEQHYPNAVAFTDEHEMEFIPTVFYGFDDRSNDCWGEDRYVPRAPDHLRQMFELAEDTLGDGLDRVNVATWSGWPEAHAIEPGEVRGDEHGTEYLEVVKEFAVGDK